MVQCRTMNKNCYNNISDFSRKLVLHYTVLIFCCHRWKSTKEFLGHELRLAAWEHIMWFMWAEAVGRIFFKMTILVCDHCRAQLKSTKQEDSIG